MFVGLISVLTGYGLQEDIAASARSFLNRGEDIVRMTPGRSPFPNHENHPPCPERLRHVLRQFSWIDQRLVRNRHIQGPSPRTLALYLFPLHGGRR